MEQGWEFSDDLMNAALELKNQLVIHALLDWRMLYDETYKLIEQMREARLEGAKE